jgi:hypothetical protein
MPVDFFRRGRGVLGESLVWLFGVDVLESTVGDRARDFADVRRFIAIELIFARLSI